MRLADTDIRSLKIVEPCLDAVPTSENGIGYGLTSAGYDARLDATYLVPEAKRFATIARYAKTHPRFIPTRNAAGEIFIPAKSMILAQTMEYLRIPANVCGHVTGKSTLARLGLIVVATPLEPGWEGHVTLELFNSGDSTLILYAGDGVCQVQFEQIKSEPETTYAKKRGRYQGQKSPTPAIIQPEAEAPGDSE